MLNLLHNFMNLTFICIPCLENSTTLVLLSRTLILCSPSLRWVKCQLKCKKHQKRRFKLMSLLRWYFLFFISMVFLSNFLGTTSRISSTTTASTIPPISSCRATTYSKCYPRSTTRTTETSTNLATPRGTIRARKKKRAKEITKNATTSTNASSTTSSS